ncbi:tyrosine-type recombinase/integrase [Microbacterium immunditiarum]|uniref:Integrase n=1 Tax=Microbacterium immunditiarum TaxID=337480 RepID=A0A7Y9GKQ9_9MICO|nr:site-specific integrase [Microbacterium immunditiarum]NYE18116.1 integrase [Microbacterium immunditiarum]
MGSIKPYKTKKGRRYLVRYRKPDNSQTDKRGFTTHKAAEQFLARVEVAKSRNEYIDPKDARATIEELGPAWLLNRTRVVKPSYARTLQSAWEVHVQPKWGARRIATILHSEAQDWVSELSTRRSATTVARAYGILAGILDTAVKDRRLSSNPVRGIKMPRKKKKPHAYLTHTQVDILAATSLYPTLVYFLAYTGLRWGEATGIRVKYVDFTRRRVRIEENAVDVGGKIIVGTPKDHEKRSVPFPRFLERGIRDCVADKGDEGLLFGDGEEHVRQPSSQDGWFVAAVKRARKIDPSFKNVTAHDLRHTAASLAISAGANVKAVQHMLGHASAAMTLDTYSDLFDDDLDAVAEALDRAHAGISGIRRPRARAVEARTKRRGSLFSGPGGERDAAAPLSGTTPTSSRSLEL